MAPGLILLQELEPGPTQLRDPRQGDARDCPVSRGVATLPRRLAAPGRDLDRPQELGVLLEVAEPQPQAGAVVAVPVPVRLHAAPQTRTHSPGDRIMDQL